MKSYIVAAVVAVSLGAAGVVLAQPRPPMGRKLDKKDKDNNQAVTPPGAVAGDQTRMCEARRNIMGNEERRFDAMQAEVAGLDAEIAALNRRLDELKKQSDEAKKTFSVSEKRVAKSKELYKRECENNESCTLYETQAAGLDNRSTAVQKDLDQVRTDIAGSRKTCKDLEGRIAPLQKEYADKKCNNLVPGETEQTTIDRCTAIFSDWNRLQADLNRENNRVPDLRSKYEALFSEMKSLEKRAGDFEGYLSKNCSASPQTAKMKQVVGVRERAQTLSQELDGLVQDISKLRGVKITVSAQ